MLTIAAKLSILGACGSPVYASSLRIQYGTMWDFVYLIYIRQYIDSSLNCSDLVHCACLKEPVFCYRNIYYSYSKSQFFSLQEKISYTLPKNFLLLLEKSSYLLKKTIFQTIFYNWLVLCWTISDGCCTEFDFYYFILYLF